METRTCVVCGNKVTRARFYRSPERTACSRKCATHLQTHPRKYASIEEQFWARVDKSGNCWIWLGGTIPVGGHGVVKLTGQKSRQAHIVAWEFANGPVPDGLQVNHSCDNPLCVRVEHMYLGTQKKNIDDMFARGRNRARPAHSLTHDEVLSIVAEYRAGTKVTELVEKYHRNANHIYKILWGKAWSNVTGIVYHPAPMTSTPGYEDARKNATYAGTVISIIHR